jgi:hypothetical protein
MHLILGCTSATLIWIVWGLQLRARRQPAVRFPAFRLALETVAVAVIALTGHLGGFLSGVNGPN